MFKQPFYPLKTGMLYAKMRWANFSIKNKQAGDSKDFKTWLPNQRRLRETLREDLRGNLWEHNFINRNLREDLRAMLREPVES